MWTTAEHDVVVASGTGATVGGAGGGSVGEGGTVVAGCVVAGETVGGDAAAVVGAVVSLLAVLRGDEVDGVAAVAADIVSAAADA